MSVHGRTFDKHMHTDKDMLLLWKGRSRVLYSHLWNYLRFQMIYNCWYNAYKWTVSNEYFINQFSPSEVGHQSDNRHQKTGACFVGPLSTNNIICQFWCFGSLDTLSDRIQNSDKMLKRAKPSTALVEVTTEEKLFL